MAAQKKKSLIRSILIIMAGCVLFFLFFGNNSIIDIIQSHRHSRILKREIATMHETIDSLQEEIKALQTDTSYIERIAREKLGMAKKDEMIYKFVEEKK